MWKTSSSTGDIRVAEAAKYAETRMFKSTEVLGGSMMLVTGALGLVAASLAVASVENTLDEMESLPNLPPEGFENAQNELKYGEGLVIGAMIASFVIILLGIVIVVIGSADLHTFWGRQRDSTTPMELAQLRKKRTKYLESIIKSFIAMGTIALALTVVGPIALQWAGISSIYNATIVGDFQLAPDYSVQLYSASYGLMLGSLFFGLLVMGSSVAIGMGTGAGILDRFSGERQAYDALESEYSTEEQW